ncbi:MAG TPA: preprotein translocase subunit SecG [Steroidobacteraceae bacterium]|nr:preprotein translocase subunit SecG [Steroidobacteraceae bacterium]
MLYSILITVHLVLATVIVGLVLIQRGKGADAGAGFGAGASGTVFGARGTHTVFSRATAVLATLFFATSAVLAFIGQPKVDTRSALEQRLEQQQQQDAAKTPPASQAPAAQPATTGTPVESAPEAPAPAKP